MNGFTLGFDNASGGVLHLPEKVRVTLLALGDVGSTLLTGLRLMGGDVISSIGICDVRPGAAERWEFELNQIQPPDGAALPPCLDSPEKAADFYEYLLSRGVSQADADGIFFENARTFLRKNLG